MDAKTDVEGTYLDTSLPYTVRLKYGLEHVGYHADDTLAAQVALMIASRGLFGVSAMLLDGDAGTGKSFLPESLARCLGIPMIWTQCHSGSNPEQFLFEPHIVNILLSQAGDEDAVQEPSDVIKMGFIAQLFLRSQEGPILAYVDELDKADPSVDAFFLTALQKGEVEVGGQVIKGNRENILLFFTKNDERTLSAPLIRRLRIHYCDYLEEDMEIAVATGKIRPNEVETPLELPEMVTNRHSPLAVAKLIVRFANLLREQKTKLQSSPTLQEIMQVGVDLEQLKKWRYLHVAAEITRIWLSGELHDYELFPEFVDLDELEDGIIKALVASSSQSEQATILQDQIYYEARPEFSVSQQEGGVWRLLLTLKASVVADNDFLQRYRQSPLVIEREGLGSAECEVRYNIREEDWVQFIVSHEALEMLNGAVETIVHELIETNSPDSNREAALRRVERKVKHRIGSISQ